MNNDYEDNKDTITIKFDVTKDLAGEFLYNKFNNSPVFQYAFADIVRTKVFDFISELKSLFNEKE